MVRQKITSYCGFDFDGKLSDVLRRVKGMIKDHGDDAILDYEQCAYDDDYQFNLYIERPENEDERAKRIAVEDEREKYERENYKRLHKKYGEK